MPLHRGTGYARVTKHKPVAWEPESDRLQQASTDALLFAIARRILGVPEDPGRANYQMAITVCSSCSGGALEAAGESISVSPQIVSMTACHAQRLDLSSRNQ